jgi:hypothetical protein
MVVVLATLFASALDTAPMTALVLVVTTTLTRLVFPSTSVSTTMVAAMPTPLACTLHLVSAHALATLDITRPTADYTAIRGPSATQARNTSFSRLRQLSIACVCLFQ